MPPTGTFTVTADTGPDRGVTSKVISGVKSFLVDINRQVLCLHLVNPDPTGPQLEFDLASITTFTATLSGAAGNWTVTVS